MGSLVRDCGAVNEVLQSTWLTLWRKFHEFDPKASEEDFLKCAIVTARFQAMNHRAKQSRNRLIFSDGATELLAEERNLQLEPREFNLRWYLENGQPVNETSSSRSMKTDQRL